MDKRQHGRYNVWFPVTLDVAGAQVWAVCHDASSSGILVFCSSALALASEVAVRFRVVPEEAEERTIRGRVVRLESLEHQPREVWTHRMAIEFFEPIPELEGVLRRQSTRPPTSLP